MLLITSFLSYTRWKGILAVTLPGTEKLVQNRSKSHWGGHDTLYRAKQMSGLGMTSAPAWSQQGLHGLSRAGPISEKGLDCCLY